MSTREDGIEEAASLLESWAEADEAGHGDGDGEENLRHAARCIRALKDKTETTPCICPGCPTQVEAHSRSGLCGPCASADCGHGCQDCLDATGGVCPAHQETECTCYEFDGAHQPGCAFNRERPRAESEGTVLVPVTPPGLDLTPICTCPAPGVWRSDCPAHGLAGGSVP